MQNVTILGITLQDRPVEESMAAAGRFLRNGALDIITLVDTDVMMQAMRDERVRKLLESSAMTEWTEAELLELAGVDNVSRMTEVTDRVFVKRQLQSMTAIDGEVALVGTDEASIAKLRRELLALEPGLKLIHDEVLDSAESTAPEAAINAINEHAPAMVISRMDFGRLQEWLDRSRDMVNVGVWLAIPENFALIPGEKNGIIDRIRRKVRVEILRHRAGKLMEGQA